MAMEDLAVPQNVVAEIAATLRSLREPSSLEQSNWIDSCLAAKHRHEQPTLLPHQVVKSIFEDTLNVLEADTPEYADLLRGLFWEGLTWEAMLEASRPKKWSSVTTFNKHRKKAIEQFAYVLWQKEQACQRPAATGNDEIVEHNNSDTLIESKPVVEDNVSNSLLVIPREQARSSIFKSYNLPGFLGLVVIMLILIGIVLLSMQPNSIALLNMLPKSSIAKPLTGHISGPNQSVCGELQRVIAPEAARFLRSEGVSSFTAANTDGSVLSDHVRSLAIDSRGLWIGYFGNGVGHYDKTSWADCGQSGEAVGKDINALAIDRMGKVWAATEKAGVMMFDGDKWHTYTIDNGLPSNETFSLRIDDKNNVWIGTWEGVAVFDGKRWRVPYSVQNNTLFNNHVYTIAFDNTGDMWIGHISHGISRYVNNTGKWIQYTTETTELGGNQIRDIIVRHSEDNRTTSVWIATADGGISRFEQGQWTHYRIEDGLPSNDVRAIALDRYNRVWAATNRGVVYFDGDTWITYNTIDTLSIAFGVKCQNCPFDDDHVWTGTAKQGLTHSRIPLPETAIDVIKVTYPRIVAPGETFRPEIVVAPRAPYQLREDRGDFLSNIDVSDDQLFGAYKHMAVKGIVDSGQPYTFTDYDNLFRAPDLAPGEDEKTFTSTWKVWMHTRYVGPPIRISFTVRRPR